VVLGFFDFLGFGSKRRSALQLLDRALSQLQVNPSYIDDGMRYAIYKWAAAQDAEGGAAGTTDHLMREAATLISFCVLGPAETEELWGAEVRSAREARFNAVLERGEEDTFDAMLIKLVLAKDIAAPDIRARAALDTPPDDVN
jgi:hypothetical protein